MSSYWELMGEPEWKIKHKAKKTKKAVENAQMARITIAEVTVMNITIKKNKVELSLYDPDSEDDKESVQK